MKIATYDTNLTDAQWAYLQPLLPKPAKRGRPPKDRRRILEAILYLAKCGCPWRYLPADFPRWKTVYHVFRQWVANHQWAVPSQTFSKLAWCKCGGKMYARTDSQKYLCRKCNNKIAIADLEGIFHEEIKLFFANPVRLAKGLAEADETPANRKSEAETDRRNRRWLQRCVRHPETFKTTTKYE